MALFEESSLRQIGITTKQVKAVTSTAILKKAYEAPPLTQRFTIFLCHSYLDADVILGLKTRIESLGYSVYVDWFEDAQFQRYYVTKETALFLKDRMANCDSLFFATSANSTYSKWMPWECGYFDGLRGLVAICPVSNRTDQYSYNGQEYLGIYPYIEQAKVRNTGQDTLWVCESPSKYVSFDTWLKGRNPMEH